MGWVRPHPTAQAPSLPSPTATGTLRGQVTDPQGAVVPNAHGGDLSVSRGANAFGDDQPQRRLRNRKSGAGQIHGHGECPGIRRLCAERCERSAGQVAQFNIALDISVQKEKVNVQEETPQVDVNPASNASAIVLSWQGSRRASRRSR